MNPDFEWQTEDDDIWRDEPPPPETPSPSSRRPLLAFLLFGTVIVGALVTWQLNRRVAVATETTEDELLASHLFIQNVDQSGDMELFMNFLSGSDKEWAEQQEALLETGYLYERAPLGLFDASSGITADDVISITLAPDLAAAEIVTRRPYTYATGPGSHEVVDLWHTSVYRRGETRWLFSPPKEEFWGEERRYNGRYLTATYPARDADLVLSLARDLDNQLARWCSQASLTCPRRPALVNFSPSPAALDPGPGQLDSGSVSTNDRPAPTIIHLPTPTIAGLSVDVEGERALLRGYARLLLARYIADLLIIEPDQYQPLFDAFIAYELADLGLAPRPDLAPFRAAYLRGYLALTEVESLWDGDETPEGKKRLLALGLVDWLRQANPALDPMLTLLTPGSAPPPIDFAAWEAHLIASAAAGQRVADLSWPQATLEAVCRPDVAAEQSLLGEWQSYHIDPTTTTWQAADPIGQRPASLNSAGAYGTLLTLFLGDPAVSGSSVTTYLRREDALLTISSDRSPAPSRFVPIDRDPSGRYILFTTNDFTPGSPYKLLDLDACDEEQCRLQSLPGYPHWSPDGRRTLLSVVGGPMPNYFATIHSLFTTQPDATSPRHYGPGYATAWLDDDTFIDLNYATDEPVIAAFDAADSAVPPAPLLPVAALFENLGNDRIRTVTDIIPAPDNSQRLVFVTSDLFSNDPDSDIVIYDRLADEVTPLLSTDALILRHRILPGSNYVALFFRDTLGIGLWLVDVTSGKIIYTTHKLESLIMDPGMLDIAWSPEGGWLAHPAGDHLQLFQPATDEVAILIPDRPLDCVSVAWTAP